MTRLAPFVTLPLVFLPPAIAGALDYEPHVLRVEFSDGERIEIAATSAATCAAAADAIAHGRWMAGQRIAAVACAPGDLFAPAPEGRLVIRAWNGLRR